MRAKPARSRPDPIVTSGRKVAPVKAGDGDALAPLPPAWSKRSRPAAPAWTKCHGGRRTGCNSVWGPRCRRALVMQASTLAVGASRW